MQTNKLIRTKLDLVYCMIFQQDDKIHKLRDNPCSKFVTNCRIENKYNRRDGKRICNILFYRYTKLEH